MKLLFLSSYAHLALDPTADRVSGGAELQVALLARELVKRGNDVVVVGGDIGQQDGMVFDGVRTRNGGRFQTGGLRDALLALPRVAAILREERPDFAVVLGWTTWLFALQLMKPLGGHRVIFICGLDTEVNGEFRRENPVRGAVFEAAVRRADVRLAMTDYQAKMFAKNGQSCGLYRNLILPRAFPRTAAKEIDLLWVARCQTIKRPLLFLDLAECCPDARCEMICPREDVALWEKVEARAADLPNVTFIERVPYREVQARYDAAKVFVNTSTAEGWPNSFIQAGLGHTALLSLDVNPDELFGRFALGIFAEGKFEQLVAGARALMDNAERLKKCQSEAARFVLELHDNDRNVDSFLAGLSVP